MNQSSSTESFDPRLGAKVKTYQFTDKTLSVSYPNDSWDHQQGASEGIYTASYKQQVGQGNLPKLQSQVETQSLLTHPIFVPGGSHALSAEDLQKIARAMSDPSLWKGYVSADPTVPLGWYAQFALWGTESWLAPVVTASVTKIVTSTPDFGNLGKTYGSIPGGNSPQLPPNCNWLLSSMESEQVGPNAWMVTSQYRASANGPWDPDLYSSH